MRVYRRLTYVEANRQNESLQDQLTEKLVEELPVSVEGAQDVRQIVSGAATPASARAAP